MKALLIVVILLCPSAIADVIINLDVQPAIYRTSSQLTLVKTMDV